MYLKYFVDKFFTFCTVLFLKLSNLSGYYLDLVWIRGFFITELIVDLESITVMDLIGILNYLHSPE